MRSVQFRVSSFCPWTTPISRLRPLGSGCSRSSRAEVSSVHALPLRRRTMPVHLKSADSQEKCTRVTPSPSSAGSPFSSTFRKMLDGHVLRIISAISSAPSAVVRFHVNARRSRQYPSSSKSCTTAVAASSGLELAVAFSKAWSQSLAKVVKSCSGKASSFKKCRDSLSTL
ncbi:Hypothetical protein [Corynebacterium glutamicum ATCC 13032]|uniref:Uncharacterized protein n=1 Tax=Corynebacterium glutamicum (strain ATCC 13032 / DSM 20300 / JCM 1318 / BCRC 11384 / CCUG 27702 / LMG 3730 / NBRC 12168 / NCIMB 10025 / NRRL B-2784 / 534) TaxID=196627 RepID=Q8NLQ3_CORGL|nr:Hypothetical protein [Corynebacterium glutamicum ATCC 13032]